MEQAKPPTKGKITMDILFGLVKGVCNFVGASFGNCPEVLSPAEKERRTSIIPVTHSNKKTIDTKELVYNRLELSKSFDNKLILSKRLVVLDSDIRDAVLGKFKFENVKKETQEVYTHRNRIESFMHLHINYVRPSKTVIAPNIMFEKVHMFGNDKTTYTLIDDKVRRICDAFNLRVLVRKGSTDYVLVNLKGCTVAYGSSNTTTSRIGMELGIYSY